LVTRAREAATPPALVDKLIDACGSSVLVGGQALALWVQFYGVAVPSSVSSISNDVDFLSPSGDAAGSVRRFASVLQGETWYPNERALTALAGRAYKRIAGEDFLNVDILRSVVGLRAQAVAQRAVAFSPRGTSFRVMHPLHVLQSRLVNLHKLPDKQNDKGVMQLRLAADVAREYLREFASRQPRGDVASGRSPLQSLVSEVERMARGDAGRKVARRHGVHVADAIDPALIPAGPFWTRRWPTLRTLMSPAYASRFSPPAAAAKLTRP
jgi:hypothetical protein